MSGKATNVALLWLAVAAFATGVGSFLVGSPDLRPIVWAHATAGFTLALLFYWKRRIIFRSIARRGLGPWLAPALLLLALVLLALGSGIAWSTVGLPDFGAYSGLTVHTVAGTGVVLLLVVHAAARWPRVRRRDVLGRRALLRSGVLLAAGAIAWRGTEGVSALIGLSGARRRFTGSREVAGGTGNDFPESNWLTDDPNPLDLNAWQLHVRGHIERGLLLRLGDITTASTVRGQLDCTGGWYIERSWSGMALADLLAAAGVRPGARSVVVRSSTGYWRRYTLAEARRALLANRVEGEPLAHGHGAPVRLVIPGMRGYEWVKWVTVVEVSTASPLLKWPLPIS